MSARNESKPGSVENRTTVERKSDRDVDARVGGKYRLVFDFDPEPLAFFGTYVEVNPHWRLAWTNEEGGEGGLGASGRPKQVPSIAFKVEKDSHLTIRFCSWRCHELHGISNKASIGRIEIVNSKEQTDSSCELLSYGALLVGSIGARQQNPRDCSAWAHHNPSFLAAIIGLRRLIFDKLKLQDVHEEVECEVVLANNERDELELCHMPAD